MTDDAALSPAAPGLDVRRGRAAAGGARAVAVPGRGASDGPADPYPLGRRVVGGMPAR